MILSVSRRTDVPNYYSDWFYNRLRDGYFFVRNPFNTHQISKVAITKELVDCIVFWTKNPRNMMKRLNELDGYNYYFQFTLTGYGRDIEPNLPDKRHVMIPTFQELSSMIGKNRVIWRYDPILINSRYTVEYHIKSFKEIAESLKWYTEKVVISYVDLYAKTKKNMSNLEVNELQESEMRSLANEFARIASENSIEIESCAEKINLDDIGIKHGSCIDQKLIEEIIGCKLSSHKDSNQRLECGCIESIEMGTYNTCLNGCRYCYANYDEERVKSTVKFYDVHSPLLCGEIGAGDMIKERKVLSNIEHQMSFFD
uniref:DUF1848 domain-containing protein n=1 Tax=Anaerosporobacter faecicola TaxID=2718714 RepID=UPI00143C9F9D|nr:DUF1848 domain-containing protein [Anaerosporobacter faecicola]